MTACMQVLASAGAGFKLSNRSVIRLSTQPADAYAGLRLNSNGQAQTINGTASTSLNNIAGEWGPAGLTGSDYEVMVTLNSGTLTAGTTGSWLGLGTSREWYCSFTGPLGSQTANVTVQIRRASSGTVILSATMSFNAEVQEA